MVEDAGGADRRLIVRTEPPELIDRPVNMRTHLSSILKWLLLASAALFLFSLTQELRTQSYLKGFGDAIVPASGSPEQKVESILAWMLKRPPGRPLDDQDLRTLDVRDPLETLNNTKFLEVCGTSVNAFLNLGRMTGVQVRPLILVGETYGATHVVAEARLDDRWIVVDPAFRRIMRDSSGRMLTKEDLKDPELLRQATVGLKKFLPIYSYKRTTVVHLEAIPYLGADLRKGLNAVDPQWEDAFGSISWMFGRRSLIRLFTWAVLCLLCSALYVKFTFFAGPRSAARVRLHGRTPDRVTGWIVGGGPANEKS